MTTTTRNATFVLILLGLAHCATAAPTEPSRPPSVVEPSTAAAAARTSPYEFDGEPLEGELVRPENAAPAASGNAGAQRMLDRAEQLFIDGDVAAATEAYRAVLQAAPERSVQGYATYKLAWCEFSLQENTLALQTFVELLSLLSPPLDDRERTLRREAVKDLTMVYASVAAAERAEAFFEHILRADEVTPALHRLGENYEQQGMLQEARAVQNMLLRREPR